MNSEPNTKHSKTRTGRRPPGVIGWVLFCVWMIPMLLGNMPYWYDQPPGEPSVGASGMVLNVSVVVGFPFCSSETQFTPTKGPTLKYNKRVNYYSGWMVLNLLIAIVGQVGILLFARRWLRQFSIKQVFLFMAIIAGLIVIGQIVFNSRNNTSITAFIVGIYLAPAGAAFLAYLISNRAGPIPVEQPQTVES